MILYKVESYDELSKKAANVISAQIILNPHSVLGLATGSSPEGTYKNLVKKYENLEVDFSNIKSVNLDEYKDIPKDNEQSYAYFMKKHLFSKVNINEKNIYIPDGLALDAEKECDRYENLIKSLGGIDLQLLGLGGNGHIGFNEPSINFAKGTHIVDLLPETIEANARFFKNIDLVPKSAFSMGIKSIMMAKKILLIVSGDAKANALYKAIYGEITPTLPASILQLHKDVIIIADTGALSVINSKGL